MPEELLKIQAATLRFLRCKDPTIPVPTPICCDDDLDGLVGGAWIVTSFVKGDVLADRIHTLTPTDRLALQSALADVYTKILQTVGTEFTAIGSIQEKTSNHQHSYTIGSMTFRPSDTTALPCPDGRGPFSSAQDWISAVMNRQREGHEDVPERPERHEENWIRVLNALKEYDQVPPTSLVLEHVGFGPSNVLVNPGDPTKIVGILGWAGARAVPFWGLNFLELDEREWAGCGLSFRNMVMRRFSDGIWYDEDLLTAAWYARKWHVLTDMSGALPFRRS
ncbi:hypothetical protein EDD18DRAFT_1332298 [Armillaria luteobubalina]|uniref:Aminoglycoside phosphotransferase domain-containing protein n=1 Tax=Armillaria luteobubalina TaxID=153913 RepID=A0AA39TN24_9AGAR|nr:hypothetical protein EDD18DRAFT_1332298 [Armillaria luteobubalina]